MEDQNKFKINNGARMGVEPVTAAILAGRCANKCATAAMSRKKIIKIYNGQIYFLDVAETSCPYPWTSMGIGYCVLRRAERNHRCFN